MDGWPDRLISVNTPPPHTHSMKTFVLQGYNKSLKENYSFCRLPWLLLQSPCQKIQLSHHVFETNACNTNEQRKMSRK